MSEDQRSESAQPRKRRGRPPLPPGQRKAKRETLTFDSTPELKGALRHVAKASGRSLAGEMNHRLRRSLDDDTIAVDDEESLTARRREILLSRLERKYPELVIHELEAMAAEYAQHARELIHYRDERAAGVPHEEIRGPAPIAEKPEQEAEPKPDGDPPLRGMYSVSKPGEVVARLLPLELDVTVGENGNVLLVSRDGGLVMETTFDLARARQIIDEQRLAVSGSGQQEQPTSIGSKRQRKSRTR